MVQTSYVIMIIYSPRYCTRLSVANPRNATLLKAQTKYLKIEPWKLIVVHSKPFFFPLLFILPCQVVSGPKLMIRESPPGKQQRSLVIAGHRDLTHIFTLPFVHQCP